MRVFFDSSAFAKRYVREQGTETVLAWCERASEISLSAIAIPEIVSALCRLRRENRISPEQYGQIRSWVFSDIEDIALCDLSPEVLRAAMGSLESSPLRAMDAIHIGSAVVLEADVFVSGDRRQCEAAARAGLRVEII